MKKKEIKVGQMFGFWKVLEVPEKGPTVFCLCTACSNTEKNVQRSNLFRGTSKQCGCKTKSLRSQTNLRNLGVENPFQSQHIKKQIKETLKEEYGVENSSHIPGTIEKRKKTNLKRYYTEHPNQNREIAKKISQSHQSRTAEQISLSTKKRESTTLEKYGVKHHLQLNEIKEKKYKTNIEKYGVRHPAQNISIQKKMQESNRKKYSCLNASQNQTIKKKKKDTRIKNENILTIDNKLVCDLIRKYEVPPTTAYRYLKDYGESSFLSFCENYTGPKLYSTERAFIEFMKPDHIIEKYDSYPKEFRLNRKPDFRLEAEDKILYINVDGLFDHSMGGRRQNEVDFPNYHFDLAKNFRANDQTIFQFRQDELRDKGPIVKSIVLNFLGLSKNKVGARKCFIKKVHGKEASAFYSENHLMGTHSSCTSYGLYYGDRLVALMGCRKKEKGIDISRFCTKLDTNVVGGFSRLLKYVEKTYQPEFIQSFLDLRYSTGRSYETCGFKLESTTLGWKWTDFENTYNRLQCRANMDNRKLTQAEHAKELGWYRIYDAGQAKYIKRLKTN